MSSGIGNFFSSVLGSKQSPKPPSRASHYDHPHAQPSSTPPKPSPISSTPPMIPPKRQTSYAGVNDPKIAHVRARRVSEMGPVGNPAKFSSHGDEGRWDHRAEARPAEQESHPKEQSVESPRKIEKLKREVRELREEKEALKEKMAEIQAQATEAYTKYKQSFEKARFLQEENQRLLSQLKVMKSDAASKEQVAGRRIAEAERRNQQQEEQIHALRQHILQSDEKQANTDRLLRERTADLKGVETFLTTADEYSGAEIMKMVESLNGEIFQVSAFMAEALENESLVATPEEQTGNIDRYRKYLEHARSEIGDGLLSHLKDNAVKVRADALPVQLSLQALLTTWCAHKVFSFAGDPLDNHFRQLGSAQRHNRSQGGGGRSQLHTYVFSVEKPRRPS